jgi:peptide/nickel transport system substrate-binding protein
MLALVSVLALAGSACGGDTGGNTTPEGPGTDLQAGGTLQLGIAADVDQAFDPAEEYSALSWEIFRCCLLRTLTSFNGQSVADGGNDPLPDIAVDQAEVSEDGLTYTYTLKEGINYSPPFEDQSVVAGDFVRAFERLEIDSSSDEGYPFYYDVIEGFEGSAGDPEGGPGSVPGVVAVDDQTLEIHLNTPAGDLPYRLSMAAAAPIPEGASEGHDDDYGRYLVATGPYMFEGSETMDFSLPPDEQPTAPGYDPGRSWSLVRNPGWDSETDELRPAYVDAIQVEINESTDVNFNKFEDGGLDLVLDGVPPKATLQKYTTDPELEQYLNSEPSDGTRYFSMNLAQPPFDDIHVRKAMNLVMDKDGLRRTRGGPLFGEIAGHFIPNSLLAGATLDGTPIEEYDPYATEGGAGDVELAKAEMAQSKYDSDGDGVCDAPECEKVLLISDQEDPYPDQNAIIADSASQIGVDFDIRSGDRYTFMYDTCDDPAAHAAFCPSLGWFKDYADAITFALPLFSGVSVGSTNYTLTGATPDLLKKAGYDVTEVPSMDDKIDECSAEPVGESRIQCWAEWDQQLMEEVVPVIPWLADNDVDIVGPRIVGYVKDAMSGLMSLEQIALVDGGAPAA